MTKKSTKSTETAEQKLSNKFTIQLNGEPREVFMSYGLLTQICGLLGSPENVGQIVVNSALRDALFEILVAERDAEGNVKKEFPVYNTEVDPDEVLELVFWAMEHALSFFIKSAAKVGALKGKLEGKYQNLQSLVNGSQT